MPAVVKKVKAQKDYPQFGVKRGQQHFTWSVPMGGVFVKFRSMTQPKKSQLVAPGYQQDFAVLQETAEALGEIHDTSDIDSLIDEITALKDETEEKYNNMPQQLQGGDTGVLMQERVTELETWIEELSNIMSDAEAITDDMEDCAEQWEQISERVQSCIP